MCLACVNIACLEGTSADYRIFPTYVEIEKTDGSVNQISKETFDYLYARLTDTKAALKDDCILYAYISDDLEEQPDWYIRAYERGLLYEFLEEEQEEEMVLLRNFQGL